MAQADMIIPPGVQGLDRYAYVNNSPMNFVDPSGHSSCVGSGHYDDGPECANREGSQLNIEIKILEYQNKVLKEIREKISEITTPVSEAISNTAEVIENTGEKSAKSVNAGLSACLARPACFGRAKQMLERWGELLTKPDPFPSDLTKMPASPYDTVNSPFKNPLANFMPPREPIPLVGTKMR